MITLNSNHNLKKLIRRSKVSSLRKGLIGEMIVCLINGKRFSLTDSFKYLKKKVKEKHKKNSKISNLNLRKL